MGLLTITHFTDPTCPYAFSAEPLLRRLEWQFGDDIRWLTKMVGLIDTPQQAADRGLSPEFFTTVYADFAATHGMPFGTDPFPRLYASIGACRAIVAARLRAPQAAGRLTRAFRVRHFAGTPVDDPDTVRLAAADAGLDAAELAAWMELPDTAAALAADMDAARHPTPEALAQDGRLAPWEGGRRYTCPSLEFERPDGRRLSAPGFQPWESYELAVANLLPNVARRPPAAGVEEVLQWAPFPLATAEVAALRGADTATVEQELAAVAQRTTVGTSAYWRL